MKAFLKSSSFWLGFGVGIFLAITIGFIDYEMKFDGLCMDCDNDFGFPFRIYQSGSLIHATLILWDGLIANVVIAIVFSAAAGVLFHFLSAKFFNRSHL